MPDFEGRRQAKTFAVPAGTKQHISQTAKENRCPRHGEVLSRGGIGDDRFAIEGPAA